MYLQNELKIKYLFLNFWILNIFKKALSLQQRKEMSKLKLR